MTPEAMIFQLVNNARRISALVDGVSDQQSRWKPDPESWSILEVINHLTDEERLDFRFRLKLLLDGKCNDWPQINPTAWVTERLYNQRELSSSLQYFLDERNESIVWLKKLTDPDWQSGCQAPWGLFTAGDLFSAWVAHDILHMRQLVELHHAWMLQIVQPYDPQYAGDW